MVFFSEESYICRQKMCLRCISVFVYFKYTSPITE